MLQTASDMQHTAQKMKKSSKNPTLFDCNDVSSALYPRISKKACLQRLVEVETKVCRSIRLEQICITPLYKQSLVKKRVELSVSIK